MHTDETKHFPDELIAKVDEILSNGTKVSFRETRRNAHVTLESAEKAEALRKELIAASWTFAAEDAVQQRTNEQEFEDDYAPFQFIIEKPNFGDDVVPLLHKSSLVGILEDHAPRVIRIGQDTHRFELYSTIVCNWDEPVEFSAIDFDSEPNRLVRDLSASKEVPSDLSIWLLRKLETAPHHSDVFNVWKQHATAVYLRVLCTEIEPDRTLVFRGQPILRISNPGSFVDIANDRFEELHELVHWVYETKREAETRHGLVVAELVRASMNASSADELVANGFKGILESSRHAYQLGLHKLSKEALQALADLRKSVGDETSKAADLTRQMTTSVAGALFAAIGVLAARLTLAKNSEAFSLVAVIVAVVLFLYVVATARTGWYFIGIQRNLRSKWKERTRKFLSVEEYSELVESPVKQAERAYRWAAWVSIAVALATAVTVVCFSYPDQASMVWEWISSWFDAKPEPRSSLTPTINGNP